MSQWKNTDHTANSVIWAPLLVNQTANSDNRDAMFGNTTADAFVTGQTIGVYGVDVSEQRAARAGGLPRGASAGWNLKRVGSGGRAGRVTYETLVAMRSITADDEDTSFPDYTLFITSHPGANSGSAASNTAVTFTVAGGSTPSGATLSYQWQANTGSGFANLSNAGAYSNVTTATLTVKVGASSNLASFRALVLATGATTVTSNSALLTITA